MAIEGKIKPNEDFWQNLSCESIYNSAEKISKATETLKTVITWAFGIFSASGFAMTVFGNAFKNYNSYTLFFLGVAFFILTIAYVLNAQAQFPVAKTYNDAQPVEIKTAFSNVVAKQSAFFKWAASLTFSGFFFVALAILIQFNNIKTVSATSTDKSAESLLVKTGAEKRGNTISIPVTIMHKKQKPVQLSFINGNDSKTVLYSNTFYTDTLGRLFYSWQLPADTIKTMLVKVTVQETNADTMLEQNYFVKVVMPK